MRASVDRSLGISDDADVTAVSGNVSTFGGSDAGPMTIISQVGRLRVGPFISPDRAPKPRIPVISRASPSAYMWHTHFVRFADQFN